MKNIYPIQREEFFHSSLNGEIDLHPYEKALKEARYLTFPLEEMLALLYQLNEFDLGRSLLINRCLTGYWRAYAILHAPHMNLKHPLENWLINNAPIARATREIFKNFCNVVQKRLSNHMVLSAIPCGLMDTFLSLDYRNTSDIRLIGVDSDAETINYAKQNVAKLGFTGAVSFYQKDAWNLGEIEKYDLIINHGLNMYEYDEERLLLLYKEFHKALTPKGILIFSFLTPPPALSDESTWRDFDPKAVQKQKAIFSEILNTKWQAFRTEGQTKEYLETAGFTVADIIYDSQGMAPTVIAEKLQ
jgi:SAM-dependent methyltransferase